VALKIVSKARKTVIARLVHNLAFTGARHTQWYGGTEECCVCNSQYEYWRHVISCQSIDAELLRSDSWSELKKAMEKWKISNDVWMAIQKRMQHYMQHPAKRDPQDVPQEPPTPFPHTFHSQRNRIKVAFRMQSHIGWEIFTKGRVSREWVDIMERHYKNEVLKLTGTECATKLIMALWDNSQRIWTYQNTRFHEKDNETVARYKREEMDRRINTIWEKQEAVRYNMLPFQAKQFANRSTVESLHYESKRCWENLAEMYTEEAQMPVSSDTYSLSAYLSARIYDG
jgi:hypothetical protein